MACRTYVDRHKNAAQTKNAFFDKFFPDNVGFIRPVRKGQTCPAAPREMSDKGRHYLVQDLDGEWIALLTCDSSPEVFTEIMKNAGIPQWIH